MKEEIKKSAQIINNGEVIIYPTDTVWGIGCDATNEKAVEKIYKLKNRTDSKTMIVLCQNVEMVEKYVQKIPCVAKELFEVSALGNTPLTLVLPNAINLAQNIIAQDKTIAIRIPQNEFCQQLLQEFKKPIVSTSANISEEKTPVDFNSITQDIIDGVDYVVPHSFAINSTQKPSSIIKVDIDGSVKIIR